ncbi:MAG: roadblock/LC7 domain-containing protein [Phototrophicaceae bacterium]|jgi:predicted regulator of Ras-like GTPase activity (Roadblock/LC7/MglB family)
MFERPSTAQLQTHLANLQSGHPSIEGMLLVSYGGFPLASTFYQQDSTSRLAAVVRTLFRVADDTCRQVNYGQARQVVLHYRHGASNEQPIRQVVIQTITSELVLAVAFHTPNAQAEPLATTVAAALAYRLNQGSS